MLATQIGDRQAKKEGKKMGKMKRRSMVIVGALAVLAFVGYIGYKTVFQQSHHTLAPTSSTSEHLAFAGETVSGALFCRVDGMVCGTCVHSVQTALGGVEGVESVSVNLRAGTAEVTIAEGESVEASHLAKALQDKGFKLSGVKSL